MDFLALSSRKIEIQRVRVWFWNKIPSYGFKYFVGWRLNWIDRLLIVMHVFIQWLNCYLSGSRLLNLILGLRYPLFQCFSISWLCTWHSLVLELKAFRKFTLFSSVFLKLHCHSYFLFVSFLVDHRNYHLMSMGPRTYGV